MVGLVLGASAGIEGQIASDGRSTPRPVPAALTAPPRPRLPADTSQIWLVPERAASFASSRAATDFATGMRLFGQARYAEALAALSSPALGATPVATYSAFYRGLCLLNLSRAAEARTAFAKLHAARLPGFLSEAAITREAEAASAQGDHGAAARLNDELSHRKTAAPDAVLLALGKALQETGDRARAAEAFARLYYEFPFSDLATVAATELDGLKDLKSPSESTARFKLDLGRAERLFGSKRYQPARQAFEQIQRVSSGDEAELIALRLAECDYYAGRHRQAREELVPYLERASRKAEAQFFHLTATRELGEHGEYVRLARALVAAFPDSSWSEETLNNLATHYILADDDEQADAVFRELYAKFPQGPRAERAAWKVGWWAYKHGRYSETTTFYESAATTFPRSDYRPAYLYWSARARERLGDQQGAASVYRIVTADYLNSYYGRLVSKRLPATVVRLVSNADGQSSRPAAESAVAGGAPAQLPTADIIRVLLSLDLYEQARDELLYAQRAWGDNPVVSATLGWVYNKQGDLRRGIIHMKRAYPHYIGEEGARLPTEVLKIIFPLDYWALIKKYAPARGLAPYLVAALINQESAFDADVKSSANAIGLMQILPSTGKHYARILRIPRFSAASLTRPDVNIQLGTAYFADLVRRFGGVHYALASYNAGETRVSEWNAGRPGLELDEFVDDIPFPETRGYVKKIIGTAEDYRRLYGEGTGTADTATGKAASGPKAATIKAAPSAKKKSPPAKKKSPPTKKQRTTTKKK